LRKERKQWEMAINLTEAREDYSENGPGRIRENSGQKAMERLRFLRRMLFMGPGRIARMERRMETTLIRIGRFWRGV
jgi:hypothetical protein